MKTPIRLAGILLLLGLAISCTQQGQESQNTQDASGSPKPFAENRREIKAEPVKRVQQWKPADGGRITLTRGVSMTMIGGSLTGLEAEPGFELAVVRINAKGGGTALPLDDVAAFDEKDKKYPSSVGGLPPLGNDPDETREFAFAVPTGTKLKRLELAKGLSLDLQ